MTSTYLIFYFNIPQLFSYNLKLSILSNYVERPKGLAPFIIRTIPFYNFKISILHKSASPFEKNDFS